MHRSKVDSLLSSRNLNVNDDSEELDHLANLLLEGSYTKEHGILAPSRPVYSGLPRVRSGDRLQDNTFDPSEHVVREQTNTLSSDGEIEQEDEDA